MPVRKILAVVNGYGVPKDIFSDLSYHAYLVQVFNYLFDRFRAQAVTIVPCGGPTDFFPPYRRTEGGEMAKWLRARIRKLGLARRWKVKPKTTGLTAVDNLLACRKLAKAGRTLYFCEKTREAKMRRGAREAFGKRATVIGIEFDGSPPRYQVPGRREAEREDLKHDFLALKNPEWRKFLHRAAEEKIQVLRKTPERVRAVEIDRIARRIRQKYWELFRVLEEGRQEFRDGKAKILRSMKDL